ncbi:MAG: AAA family ATPase [Phycisphaerales bacterium]|nr:AAA family ATPase [Phycisphaerales bacterium]
MRTVAIVNQKGGCGKTTTAINLSSVLANRGERTLLVDMDPQSHCAAGLGVPEARIERSIADALLVEHGRAIGRNGLLWEVGRNLDLLPSTMALSGLEAPGGGMYELPDRDRRLAALLGRFVNQYDMCVIDCPPTIGLLTFNALRAADEAIIPVETGYFSMRGAEKQWATIERLIARLNRPLPCHILPTLYDDRSRLAREILSSLRRRFEGRLLPVIVREHAVLREAASFGQPVTEYAPESEARADFEELAEWLLDQPLPHAGEAIASALRSVQANRSRGGQSLSPLAQGSTSDPAANTAVMEESVLDRATELAHRVRELSAQAEQLGDEMEQEVAVVSSNGLALVETMPDAPPTTERSQHLLGVRQTARGVMFLQPLECGRTLAIAGDFNQWDPVRLPLRPNRGAGVHEAIAELEPGTYEYRVVVDGRWQPDPFNPDRRPNAHGDMNSILTVVARSA